MHFDDIWPIFKEWIRKFWAASWQNQQNDHPGKTQISLGIRFLHMDSEDWSDWADAHADLSLHWSHMSFCWFCHEAAQTMNNLWMDVL